MWYVFANGKLMRVFEDKKMAFDYAHILVKYGHKQVFIRDTLEPPGSEYQDDKNEDKLTSRQ